MSRKQLALFEPVLLVQALTDAVKKLSPRAQWRNPVMFVVWAGSVLTTLLTLAMVTGQIAGSALFTGIISLWLWFTVLFANFAEALAEGRSKAQANSLKGVKKTAFARRLRAPRHDAQADNVPAAELRKGDIVLVKAGDIIPARGVDERTLADAAQLASLADETPEGRSIVILAKQRFNLRERDVQSLHATFVPFTAQSRMSGINIDNRMIRKGSVDAIRRHVESNGGHFPADVEQNVENVARLGATPLVVVEGAHVLGVIALKDIVKGGIKERFAQLRKMGIKTVMITGDNRLTAAAIAAEAGVDDFLAEATPEAKLALIRQYQAEGRLVAMTGDGTNDAPALAQADVAVAMNSGTQAAKEAGNMVDLDSNPTKLIEVVHIGKQMLMTRGSLTTFSIANDVAKYFAIIPAAFAATYPQLNALNVMGLHSPNSAILSAVIFNALIIIFLIPLALKGVSYKPLSASAMLRRNLWIYGLGGLVVPFIGIKVIDVLLTLLGLA
ncbi:potassium-transporting ATPase subunit KdpB [Salmonella enterica]|nr:potassium-transporting ATPase subunit KdpB [Salmonella enterica]EMA6242025.1 potassium-transporting ATPase subunit KdpB [Salmonella enterica]EMB8615908.1 potassium-transporting ATPase subunit KdpB [Salmonella enterica]EMC3113541.1 potassium-transporting ATPase subunit KdpB [Salmonella enterica]EMD8496392.1 potassium-transporting ATPase subunit KdpB [Salmonella enterica]